MVGRKVDSHILFGARSEKPKIVFSSRGEKWKNLFGAKWQLLNNLFGSQRVNHIILIEKLQKLDIPHNIINWIIHLLIEHSKL